MAKNKKRKISKKKKKFFIIASCYLATFIITSIITMSTLAWFSGSTFQDEALYMGGPVYIHFSDNSNTPTSGKGKLKTELPAGWDRLYPGMNIVFEASAVIEGHTFNNTTIDGEPWYQYTSTSVLRAMIRLEVYDPSTGGTSIIAKELYDWVWPQLKQIAITDMTESGKWIFDELDTETAENNYFYYVEKNQSNITSSGEYLLNQVGGLDTNISIDFLNNAIIQLPGIELTNKHADCDLTFIITFEAVQAFFPYTRDEVGVAPYQGDTTGRSEYVTDFDVGLAKPLTIANSRKIFTESQYPYS